MGWLEPQANDDNETGFIRFSGLDTDIDLFASGTDDNLDTGLF
jgi:hypothetical protein